MDDQTLYYTLSTIPQILVAMTAIAGAFIFFRFSKIIDFLVGDGQAALDRINRNEDGYRNLSPMHKGRLQDALSRRNFYEIEKILELLSDKEKQMGLTLKERPTGLQNVYENRFLKTKRYYFKLRRWTKFILVLSIFEMLLSIFSIGMVDLIIKSQSFCLVISANIGLFTLSMIGSAILLYYALADNTPYEK